MPVTLTKGLDEKCCDCGIALKKIEIDGEFVGGNFIDYGEHTQTYIDGDRITMKFCSGCKERIKTYLNKDQGDAILKRKELEKDEPFKPLSLPDVDIEGHDVKMPDGAGVGM